MSSRKTIEKVTAEIEKMKLWFWANDESYKIENEYIIDKLLKIEEELISEFNLTESTN